MSESFYRCNHCRGFYETTFEKCKWCEYQTPTPDPERGGEPKVFPDRAAARAIQLAEHERLSEEVRTDPMGPPANNLTIRCGCIHCGEDGHDFEAIEMRWMANEQMWACPCTTCGGRGFQFDIHPVERVWQCPACDHWYTPEGFTYDYANCPKCGCKDANGWFDDSDEDEDGELFDEDGELIGESGDDLAAVLPREDVPWKDDVEPYDPARPDEEAEFPPTPAPGSEASGSDRASGEPKMLDDIDYPRHFEPDSADGTNRRNVDEGDIPF